MNRQGSPLPAGWSWTTLADIADLKGGVTKGQKRRPTDALRVVPYLRVANVQRGYLDLSDVKVIEASEQEIDELRLQPGDVLFNEGGDRDKLGRGWVWRGELPECIHQNHVFRARLRSRGIHPQYISWYGNAVGQGYFIEQGRQTTNLASLNLTNLGQFPVALPPGTEQGRIVAEIDKHFTRLDTAVASLKRAQANLKSYRTSVLSEAYAGRLVPTEARLAEAEGRTYEPASQLLERIRRQRGSGSETEPEEHVTSRPHLPPGWTWTSMGQVFGVYVGATPSRAKPEYWNGDIPWVSSGEVAFTRLRDTREKITNAGLRHTSTQLHPPGTVLLGMIGEGKTRGQVAILDIPACNNQNSAAIRVSEVGLPPEYVYHYLVGQYEQTRTLGSGNNQPALNKTSVQRMLIPVAPLAEQHRLIAEVERLMSNIVYQDQLITSALSRAEQLRKSILQRAFEGKLVPQDPNDEPASALLERIERERRTAPARPNRLARKAIRQNRLPLEIPA